MSIQQGAIGATIILTYRNPDTGSVMDLSDATVKNLVFKRPSGETFVKAADYVTDGADGKLKYVTVDADDTMPAGAWRIQAEVVKPDYEGRSRPALYYVYANL